MLARAGFGNNALFAHFACQQNLSDAIVDLVRTGVVQVFTLEPDLRPAQLFRPAAGVIDRAGTPDKMRQFVPILSDKIRIFLVLFIGLIQLRNSVHQRFGDKNATVTAEMAPVVGKGISSQIGSWRRVQTNSKGLFYMF